MQKHAKRKLMDPTGWGPSGGLQRSQHACELYSLKSLKEFVLSFHEYSWPIQGGVRAKRVTSVRGTCTGPCLLCCRSLLPKLLCSISSGLAGIRIHEAGPGRLSWQGTILAIIERFLEHILMENLRPLSFGKKSIHALESQ